ncbi:MAG: hypothetical protein GY952_10375 [Rhodobacteraceae bacterium]|nr:hypothetical protein [Paracoccaceae bacterium]
MNKYTKVAVFSAALVAIVGAAAVPTVAKGRHHWDFEKIDANSDGFLTLEEVATVRDQKFEEMDANKDGSLSKEEIAAHRQERQAKWEESRGERAKEAFAKMDTDNNGAISQEELEAAMEKRESNRKERRAKREDGRRGGFMKHVDANDDGKVTKAELTTAYTTRLFERLDTDKDSKISKAEAEEARKGFFGHRKHD